MVIVVAIVVVVVIVLIVLIVFFDFSHRFEAAKQAVAFVVGTGGEVKRAGNSSPAAVPERERPERVNHHRIDRRLAWPWSNPSSEPNPSFAQRYYLCSVH